MSLRMFLLLRFIRCLERNKVPASFLLRKSISQSALLRPGASDSSLPRACTNTSPTSPWFLTICHNLLGLHHVAEFKLASGSLASAFLTKPAGFKDLRAAFFRLWETWVRPWMYEEMENFYHTNHIITRILSGTRGDHQDTRGPAYRLRTPSLQSSPCLGNRTHPGFTASHRRAANRALPAGKLGERSLPFLTSQLCGCR